MRSIPCAALLLVVLLVSACSPAPTPVLPTETPLPPTITPTLTASPTPTAVPDGPCDNPLVPLVTGNEWQYRVSGGSEAADFTLRVLERADIGNINIGVQIIDHKHQREIQELVICDEGTIVNFPLYLMSMLLVDQLKGVLDTYHFHQSGPYAPSYAELAGSGWSYSWKPEYLLEENAYLVNPTGGADLAILSSSPIHLDVRMDGGFQSIDIPAGITQEAILVRVVYQMAVTIVEGGAGSAGSLDIHTSQWYVPFVGLVRAQIDSTLLEYYGQVFSAPITSVLELTSFTPGQ